MTFIVDPVIPCFICGNKLEWHGSGEIGKVAKQYENNMAFNTCEKCQITIYISYDDVYEKVKDKLIRLYPCLKYGEPIVSGKDEKIKCFICGGELVWHGEQGVWCSCPACSFGIMISGQHEDLFKRLESIYLRIRFVRKAVKE